MKNAIVLDQNDIKRILAEKYGVKEADIIKSQYSYIIVKPDEEGEHHEH